MIIINKKEQPFLKSIFSICKSTRTPLLNSITITTDEEQGTVTFTATDLHTVVEYKRMLHKEEQPCRKFILPYEMLCRKINNELLKISFEGPNNDSQYNVENGIVNKTVIDGPNNPDNCLPDIGLSKKNLYQSFMIPFNELLELAPFASEDASRPGIYKCWGVKDNAVFCTDGTMLAYHEIEDDVGPFIVKQYKPLLSKQIAKRFNEPAVIQVWGTEHDVKENNKVVGKEKVNESSVLILGNPDEQIRVYGIGDYLSLPPNYKQVIPSLGDAVRIRFTDENLKMLQEFVNQKCGMVIIKRDGFKGIIDGNNVEIKTQISTDLDSVAFDPAKLVNAINYSETSKLSIHDSLSAARLDGKNELEHRHVVLMTMRSE